MIASRGFTETLESERAKLLYLVCYLQEHNGLFPTFDFAVSDSCQCPIAHTSQAESSVASDHVYSYFYNLGLHWEGGGGVAHPCAWCLVSPSPGTKRVSAN